MKLIGVNMEELGYILKSDWDKIIYPYYKRSSIDYTELMQWLEIDNYKPAKTQEITDNIIEEYFE